MNRALVGTPPFRSSAPCRWVQPRQTMHPSERIARHGPVQPMEEVRHLYCGLRWLSRWTAVLAFGGAAVFALSLVWRAM